MVEKKIKVLYIAGAGRSGTTLLDQYLGSCHGFNSVGEIKYLIPAGFGRDQRCSCKDKLKSCVVWGGVYKDVCENIPVEHFNSLFFEVLSRKKIFQQIFPFLRGRRYKLALSRLSEMIYLQYKFVSDTVEEGVTIVDSSKDPGYLKVLTEVPGLEVYVLHCIRDPRGVVYSRSKKKKKTSLDHDEYMPLQSTASSLAKWCGVNILTSLVVALSGVRSDKLNYETYVNDLKSVDNAVAGLGLGQPVVEKKDIHTCLGNPSKTNSFDVRIVRGEDDRWRKGMPKFRSALIYFLLIPLFFIYKIPR